MIIKDKIKLQEKCSPVSVKEGEEIGVRLLHELRIRKWYWFSCKSNWYQ